ncbi:MAG: THxN family PEP-CTERM protein [Burkholderiales bacterium]|nr:THxN family PEP-CTERM protein [Burkholderiales bacterium]OJX06778.1 MAG: hypothetical protein BGO72_00315 [Burkholderiales bacterium 70-64]
MATRSTFKVLAALALGLGSAAAAQAALITEWGYSVTTEWGNGTTAPAPVFTSGGGVTHADAAMLSWGASNPPNQTPNDTSDPNTSRSGLIITPDTAVTNPPNLFTNGAAVDTHTITHYNNTISSNFSTLSTASVFTTLTLTPLVPGGPSLPTLTRTFQVDFSETPNTSSPGTCGFPSTSACDDIFVLTAGSLTQSFVLDGITYTLEILATGLGPLPAATCAAAGAAPGCIGFQTLEHQATPAQFSFKISAQVPEPAILGLLGLGLAGIGFVGRLRRS